MLTNNERDIKAEHIGMLQAFCGKEEVIPLATICMSMRNGRYAICTNGFDAAKIAEHLRAMADELDKTVTPLKKESNGL